MNHTSWRSVRLGAESPCHVEPATGGAPVVSPDGHWRWDGERWALCTDAVHDHHRPASADGPEASDGAPPH